MIDFKKNKGVFSVERFRCTQLNMDILKDNSERILALILVKKELELQFLIRLKMFAIPLTTLKNILNFGMNLKKLISNYNIVYVVIGYPYKDDGSKTICD